MNLVEIAFGESLRSNYIFFWQIMCSSFFIDFHHTGYFKSLASELHFVSYVWISSFQTSVVWELDSLLKHRWELSQELSASVIKGWDLRSSNSIKCLKVAVVLLVECHVWEILFQYILICIKDIGSTFLSWFRIQGISWVFQIPSITYHWSSLSPWSYRHFKNLWDFTYIKM